MLEFDFDVLILHLMSSYSCVNNLMHIPANYSCDSKNIINKYDTRSTYYSIYVFYFSIETQPWTVHVFAYVFSIVFAEYVFSIEMWISIL